MQTIEENMRGVFRVEGPVAANLERILQQGRDSAKE